MIYCQKKEQICKINRLITIIAINMQKISEKICQKIANKEEKVVDEKPVLLQAQIKTVQKVVKNPLMAKKNPLMRKQVPIIKQTQLKPAGQTNVCETKVENKSNEEEVKSTVKQQQSQKLKKDVQEMPQLIKIEKSVEEDKLKDEKKELKVQQPKKQPISVCKQQNIKNPIQVPKNPLMPKQTLRKQTKQIKQTKKDVIQQSKKQLQKPTEKIVVDKSEEKAHQTKEKVDSKIISEVKIAILQPEVSTSQKNEAKQQYLPIKLSDITEKKQQKIIKQQQKKLEVKEEVKNKQIKTEQHKPVNPLAAKKNPFIKSEMIFKPSEIRHTVNPLLPKSSVQPIAKQEIKKQYLEDKKKEQKAEIKVESVHPSIQKKQKIEQKIQDKASQNQQKLADKTQQQTISNTRFDSSRFSLGMITDQRVEQKGIHSQVEIKITDSIQKGTALSKYIVYQLEGKDKLGPFRISRKYTQFEAIRKIIRQRWPGCFIPSIHSKSELKSELLKQKQIRSVLQNFLLGLSYSQHIFYKQQVQLFLRSPQIDIVQMVKQMPILKAKDVINRYNSCFGEEMFQKVSQSENSAKIKKFIAKLRKIIASLSSMSVKVQILSESYDNYATTLSRFEQISKSYEQLCLSEYTSNNRGQAIIIKEQSTKLNKLKELPKYNPFNKLYSFINNQARDAQSFLQIMIASQLFVLRKNQLQTQIKQIQNEVEQISLGHKTLKTMTTRKSKQEVSTQLQAQKKRICDEKENIVQIFKITEIILANKEIEFFKTFKRNTYRGVLREWIAVSAEINPQLVELWKFIQDSARQALKGTV